MNTLKGICITALALFAIPACKNVDKLVEQGRYNEAIEYAVKKLAGEKDKKVEYVKALEKSFNRLNESQMNDIHLLANQGRREDWSKVIYLSKDIMKRQSIVAPLNPLIAKNGYKANLRFYDVDYWYQLAVEDYLALSWEEYNQIIGRARAGDKHDARKAYYLLEEIGFYEDRSGLQQQLEEAKQLATDYILMKVVMHEDARLNASDIHLIKEFFRTEPVREIWSELHLHPQANINYDYLSEVAIKEVIVTPSMDERTIERVSRQVQNGEKAMRDKNGKVVVDSSGEVIMVPVYETVWGETIRVRQFKEVMIQAEIRIIQRGEGRPIATVKKTSGADFKNEFKDWRGDKRAFEYSPKRGRPVPYPPDQELIREAVDILQEFTKEYTVDRIKRLG